MSQPTPTAPGLDPWGRMQPATPDHLSPWLDETLGRLERFARNEPWTFGLWMLGIGFVLGWKLKPW
jgi:hypothetical protein